MGELKIGFVGGGNMATAIIHGILHGGNMEPEEIAVYGTNAEKQEVFRKHGLKACKDAKELVRACRFVLLSVKPQVLPSVLEEIAPCVTKDHVLISIAAGITCEFIREKVGFPCSVVPVMPNTPLLVGCGAVAMARVQPIAEADFEFVRDIFAMSGSVELVPEDKLNEVIPVNGSSPAFIYLFAKIASEYGARYGLDQEVCMRLFCNTLIGSAKMLLESDKSPDELIRAVCSPGGATLKGLEALEQHGFEKALNAAADACIKRAYELGQ